MFPKAVFFIIGNEFCERFSFYGMRAVLILYLTQQLLLDRAKAKLIYHSFYAICYFMPVFGALLADLALGKFRTILFLSLVYASGNILLSVSSIPPLLLPRLMFAIISLVVIGIGSGGIKPCVSAFGGDQFEAGQDESRDKFFAVFYWTINAGAVISMFVTPLLRAEVQCFNDDCYPLAFGFPAILMITATILFIVGKRFYKIIPSVGSALINFAKCSGIAMLRRYRLKEKRKHWVQYADHKYDDQFITEVKSVWSLLCLFCPLPMFWALFDQLGSAWTLQSSQMDGRLGEIEFHPDQMDSLNSFFVITFIPLFTYVLYPALGKCHLLRRPLQRMATGGFLAAIAFAMSGFIQLSIETELPFEPSINETDVIFINTSPCKTDIRVTDYKFPLNEYGFSTVTSISSGNLKGSIYVKDGSENCVVQEIPFTINAKGGQAYMFAFGMDQNQKIQYLQKKELRTRDPKGFPLIRVVYLLTSSGGSFLIKGKSESHSTPSVSELFGITDYVPVSSYKDYSVCWSKMQPCKTKSFHAEKGGFYAIIYNEIQEEIFVHEIIRADWLSMFWQIPQYVVMTAGEVMLSITGLAFAYSQAPFSMKSVLQAAWLMTIAVGNIIVMIIEQIKEHIGVTRESYSFFTYAVIMFLDMLLFSTLASFYQYVEDTKEPHPAIESETEENIADLIL